MGTQQLEMYPNFQEKIHSLTEELMDEITEDLKRTMERYFETCRVFPFVQQEDLDYKTLLENSTRDYKDLAPKEKMELATVKAFHHLDQAQIARFVPQMIYQEMIAGFTDKLEHKFQTFVDDNRDHMETIFEEEPQIANRRVQLKEKLTRITEAEKLIQSKNQTLVKDIKDQE